MTGTRTKIDSTNESVCLLPIDFEPTKFDVICQRGKECYDHGKYISSIRLYMMIFLSVIVLSLVGNRRFRIIIDNHLHTYMQAPDRRQKSKIVTAIVRSIRSASESGEGFIRKVGK